MVGGSVSGSTNLTVNASATGGSMQQLVDRLAASVQAQITDGTIKKGLLVDKLSGALQKFVTINDVQFSSLKTSLLIKDGTVDFKRFTMLSDAGDWNVGGTYGFDSRLGLSVRNKLTKAASSRLLAFQNKGKSALHGLFGGGSLGSLLDEVGIPADNQGRVTVITAVTGSARDPKVEFRGFEGGDSTSSGNSSSGASDSQTRENAVRDLEKRIPKDLGEKLRKLF